MPEIVAIPAFNDNYIWMITHPGNNKVAIVDPGDAAPVIEKLTAMNLDLAAILITHHHWDHTNGIAALVEKYKAPVYGPANDPVSPCDHPLQHDDQIHLEPLNLDLHIIDIPGHTLGHIAYYSDGFVLTGDTLFTGGCGRLFEGTPEQMHSSLNRLAALPPSTLVYCGHEYTQKNLEFAKLVEPENAKLIKRIAETDALRAQGKPTVPSTIALERATNPFLRCDQPTVITAVEEHDGQNFNDTVSIFAALRKWKDNS